MGSGASKASHSGEQREPGRNMSSKRSDLREILLEKTAEIQRHKAEIDK